MGLREGFLFLLVLLISWTYADADSLVGVMPIDKISRSGEWNEQLCTLCEEFTAKATYYFRKNKTHDEIIDTLHQACSRLYSYEQQCVILVDYYTSLFFVEIAKIHPEEFCTKVNLCEETVYLSLPKRDDACSLCHRVVVDILMKLKDPDTQMGIIKVLLEECKKMGNYAQECKRLIFQYGPLILANGEKFLETTDICAYMHACQANQAAAFEAASLADAALLDA